VLILTTPPASETELYGELLKPLFAGKAKTLE